MVLTLDFDELIGKDDYPPPELLILRAAEVDVETENTIRRLSDKQLHDKITRSKGFLKKHKLADGGAKLKALLKKLEAELERRSLYKDDDKCKRVKTVAGESTIKGVANDLSHPGVPPSKPVSNFGLLFCSKMEDNKATKCFGEELHTLNRPDPKNIRKHKLFPSQLKQNKVSSREAPFKPPNYFSVNISRKRINCERRGGHSYDTLTHLSDKDASCCLTKKENGARSPLPFHSRRNNRKTIVLDLEDAGELEDLDAVVVNKADELDQSCKRMRIYYPSRDDPVAIEICYSDLECLAPESYLSSPIMNFYIRYLQMPTFPSASRKHDHHIFNTYFYEKLKQEVLIKMQPDKEASFSKFRRWWKDVNIFEKAYILLPIHENVHWSLVIICMPDKENELGPIKEDESGPIILHLDSLGLHSSKSIFSNVKSFLIEEWNHLKREGMPEPSIAADNIWNRLSRRIDEKIIEVPQQKNEYDCGLFVLYFMELFINEAPERLKKRDLEMFGRQWFRPEEASNLRVGIHNMLKEEFKNASEDT